MKTQLQTLGVIFLIVGGLIGVFILFALVLGALGALGIVHGDANQNLSSALVVLAVLMYPTIWIMQTGLALFWQRKSGRFSGIALCSILFVFLNVILLLTKDQPGKTGKGFLTFHIVMIVIGVYGLILLVPSRIKKALQ